MGRSSVCSLGRNLLSSRFDHESCGVGFVATLNGASNHHILRLALTALGRLAHRGAVAADRKSSDGVGILTAIPRRFLLKQASVSLPAEQPLAVGMLFLPQDEAVAAGDRQHFQECISSQGLQWLAWRDVPIRREVLGEIALASLPVVRQGLITTEAGKWNEAEVEHRLYLARKAFERQTSDSYVCSLSTRTIVYKALCAGRLLHDFYPDLGCDEFVAPFAIFHQRYATNVLPSWHRAQPLRIIAHNGEINTIWGNRAHMEARRATLPHECEPFLSGEASDSMSLDEVAELLANHDRNVAEAVRMLLPPAAIGNETLFHRYHADCMEPWDGPSALVFTDGRLLGAALDRNGLRPCRYVITDTGLIVAGSEVGLADVSPDSIVRSGRLGPGQMILLDLERDRLLDGEALDRYFDELATYATIIDDIPLEPAQEPVATLPEDEVTRLERGFGYTREDLKMVIAPMALEGKEATWSMGDDTPIAPLARTPRPLYGFFRQRFAQVTNPAIDSLRESIVVSLRTRLGPWPHLLDKHAPLPGLVLPSPFLSLGQMAALHEDVYAMHENLPLARVDCTFPHGDSLQSAIDALRQNAVDLVAGGARILLLTDRSASPQSLPIPMAMATGAVHHALVQAGLRTKAGLALEAGDCRDVHHAAVLIGYGAGAVCPWLMLQTARSLAGEEGEARLLKALQSGLAKVMSKMGISVLDSYRAAQLFDILGLDATVVESCFPGSLSPLGGLGFAEIEEAVRAAWGMEHRAGELPDFGWVRFRRDEGAESHLWEPQRTRHLQLAVGAAKGAVQSAATAPSQLDAWSAYKGAADDREPIVLRDLLEFRAAGQRLSVYEVEQRSSLAKRFVSSAMSLGSISPEAHQTITLAMNQLGGRSNTGEGGEDPIAYLREPDAPPHFLPRNNKIKQVASARFGVTAEYLAHAEELEIKIAQGSKPGEGGQLPGHKVTELIARLRHAQPGIPLISPPPHHDIYSIEDLAQLIYDLKRVNPRAAIGVKLVSQLGVGTVAAGVAKAYADYIHIAGHSGGTGASPLSSIKYAGSPWELGLAEAQQVLRHNGLRGRVRLRVDGGFGNARDVLIAALLGADEFSFGTAVLVAIGCDMARQCHLNTCPTGIATQRPDLRARFRGKPENVVRFFLNIAEDLQRLLAALGLPSLESAIGRTDLLQEIRSESNLDLGPVLASVGDGPLHWEGKRNARPEDHAPLDDAWMKPALAAAIAGRPFEYNVAVRNEDRCLGARLAGELAMLRCRQPLVKPDLCFRMRGTAGQSFGAFATEGMSLVLEGQANDYVGKGLAGGELILRPWGKLAGAHESQVIMGNVALYGATSGLLFAAGTAGERFAIRNSGATAVVEGVGEHGCEYMTGGMVVVLGATGRNFGAGMTGGTAYVWDPAGSFRTGQKFHPDFVETRPLEECASEEQASLHDLLHQHARKTGSRTGQKLIGTWPQTLQQMLRVAPKIESAM
ncbi:MAG: glutamate synthase large subunit [Candidatus Korobacteraceae bacterium]